MSDTPAAPQDGDRSFLPAMGRPALLPLYDPMTLLLGARSAHRRLLAGAGIGPGSRVLEIGCGTGNLVLAVQRAHPRASVTGLDPDPDALALARRKAVRAGLEVRLDRGFADRLPYPDGSVDRVLSAFMLHHLPTAEKLPALREVRRVLGPDGSLHLLDVAGEPAGWHRLLARLTSRSHRHGSNGQGHGQGHGHGRGLGPSAGGDTAAALAALLTEAGFADVAGAGHGRTAFGPYVVLRARRGSGGPGGAGREEPVEGGADPGRVQPVRGDVLGG